MMKHPLMVFLLACALPLASAAQPRESALGVAAFGGVSFALSPSSFVDVHTAAFPFGAELYYQVSPRFTLGARVAWMQYGVGEEEMKTLALKYINLGPGQLSGGHFTSFSGEGGEFSQLVVTANLRYLVTPPEFSTGISLLFGAGLYSGSTSDFHATYSYVAPNMSASGEVSTTVKGSDPHFGVNGGAGITYWMTDYVGLLVEGRYHMLLTTDEGTSFFSLAAGARFHLGS